MHISLFFIFLFFYIWHLSVFACLLFWLTAPYSPLWGTEDEEIKDPFVQNPEPKCFRTYMIFQNWNMWPTLTFVSICSLFWLAAVYAPLWVLRTQKLKTHLLRTQSSQVLPLKPGERPYIDMYVTPTARDFFLDYFYPTGPFTCIFSETSPDFFLWLTLVPV